MKGNGRILKMLEGSPHRISKYDLAVIDLGTLPTWTDRSAFAGQVFPV